MSRSSKKGPFVDPKLLKKISLAQGKPVKTWSRASEISPEMVGSIVSVHNGKIFIDVRITEEMVGHRLGEFSPTRKFVRHGGKLQKQAETASKTAPKVQSKK